MGLGPERQKVITKTYEIKAPIAEVWKALTDPEYIEDWGGGPAKMAPEAGFEFSLWGGDIWGTNKVVEPEKKLIQDWYGGKWAKPSNVCFVLRAKDGKTFLDLTHQGVPAKEKADIDNGWDEFYLGPLKEYLEHI